LPTAAPSDGPRNYCREGYADYGVRYNKPLGRITISATHELCSARCTKYSGVEYSGGCKSYMTGMYFGMLFCRSYGGLARTVGCAAWANPGHKGMFSGPLGSVHPQTKVANIGGNCCSNSTFVAATMVAGDVL